MSRRTPSLQNDSLVGINREIGSQYDNVKIVADNIEDVAAVSSNTANVDTVAANIGAVSSSAANMASIITTAANIDNVNTVSGISLDVSTLAAIDTALVSLFNDKATLDSLYADKVTLDSLFADKATLDSLFADKTTLDSLYADKLTLDTLYDMKATLDSIYADKTTLDSLYADKLALDTLYANITAITTLYASIGDIQTVSTNITDVNAVGGSISGVNTVSADIVNVNTVATNIADVNEVATQVVPNIAEILLADDNAATATQKALEASNSASAALGSENAAATTLAAFNDKYLGSFTSAPTSDNSGNLLTDGDLYFNTSTNLLNVYDLGTDAWLEIPNIALASLVDVELTSITAGDVLKWNGTKWINTTLATELDGRYVNTTGDTMTDDLTVPNLITSGLVDGRDVSVDGTKLDTIEPNAKDDQVWGEIGGILSNQTDLQSSLDSKLDDSQLDTSPLLGTSDASIPSQNAVKTYVDNSIAGKDEAIEIGYNNTTSGLAATEVQSAIDEVDGRLDTAESKLSGIEINAKDDQLASEVPVTPVGNLTSTNVQSGLEELQTDIDNINTGSLDGTYVKVSGDTMTGNLTVPNLITTGNVDGRDVSVDGAKLDGIEPGATVDQTATEILDLVKTVDGAGSGLNADLLDGKDSSTTAVANTIVARDANGNIADYYGSFGNLSSPLLDLPLQNSLSMSKGVGSVNFTRASTAMYRDRYGVLQTASVDEPRFEKDGLLIERASTNLVTYSNDLENTKWESHSATVSTDGTVAPDGTSLAYKITVDADVGRLVYSFSGGATGVDKTFSVFAKRGNTDLIKTRYYNETDYFSYADFNIVTEEFTHIYNCVNPKYEKLNNGWYRISYTIENVTDITNEQVQLARGTAGEETYFWGAQLEELPFASSYIPTIDSAVTRDQDRYKITYTNNIPRLDGDWTFYIKATKLQSDGLAFDYLFGFNNKGSSFFGLTFYNNYVRARFNDGIQHELGNASANGYFRQGETKGITVVKNGDTVSIYTDGEFSDSGTWSDVTNIKDSSNEFWIGSVDGSVPSAASTNVEVFKCWDKSLTATEVKLLSGGN